MRSLPTNYYLLITTSGFGLIEIVVAIAMISLALFGGFTVVEQAGRSRDDAVRQVQATLYLEEAVEAMRFVRDTGWANLSGLSLDTDYYLSRDSTGWHTSVVPTGLISNLFDRRVRVSAVARDAESRIVLSGGTVDTNTKLVSASVSWLGVGGTTTRTMRTYLTNRF